MTDEHIQLEDEEKLLKLAARGLAQIAQDDKDAFDAAIPPFLKSSTVFARHVCYVSAPMVQHFDPSLLENKSFLLDVLKEYADVYEKRNYHRIAAIDTFIHLIPAQLFEDTDFILKALKWHSKTIYNRSAHKHQSDSEYAKVFIESYQTIYDDGIEITAPISKDIALQLCQLKPKAYKEIKKYFKEDIDLACAAVRATKDEPFLFKHIDSGILAKPKKLARVVVCSTFKDCVEAGMSDNDISLIYRQLKRIAPNQKFEDVYDAAQFICAHEDAKLERSTMGKAAPAQRKSAPKDAFKNTL